VTMTAALKIAGLLQTHLQYVVGQEYMDVQQQLTMFYWMRLGGGVLTLVGLVTHLAALLVLPSRHSVPAIAPAPAE
jgi:nitric oxide reductase subunit B